MIKPENEVSFGSSKRSTGSACVLLRVSDLLNFMVSDSFFKMLNTFVVNIFYLKRESLSWFLLLYRQVFYSFLDFTDGGI